MNENLSDKRKIKGAKTKKKLYEIAESLFRENNPSDVTVEMITEKAGITKGAFYVHFASKDALMYQLMADQASHADSGYKAFSDSLPEDMPVSEVLLALGGKIADTIMNSIGCENMKKVYILLLTEASGTNSVKGYDRELYSLLCGLLEKGAKQGEFSFSIPTETLSRHFVTAIRGVCYEWCVRYPDFDFEVETKAHLQLLIDGIQKKPTV